MYSEFWKRLLSFTLDRVLLSILILLITFMIGIPSNESLIYSGINPIRLYSESASLNSLYVLIFIVLLPWLYSSLFESSVLRATPGKKILKIFVTDLNGDRISFKNATIRYYGKHLSFAFFGIGILMIFTTENKQALHDYLAKSVVRNSLI